MSARIEIEVNGNRVVWEWEVRVDAPEPGTVLLTLERLLNIDHLLEDAPSAPPAAAVSSLITQLHIEADKMTSEKGKATLLSLARGLMQETITIGEAVTEADRLYPPSERFPWVGR